MFFRYASNVLEIVAPISHQYEVLGSSTHLEAMVRMIQAIQDIQVVMCGLDGEICGRLRTSGASLTWNSEG